jgi:hypothetical protein
MKKNLEMNGIEIRNTYDEMRILLDELELIRKDCEFYSICSSTFERLNELIRKDREFCSDSIADEILLYGAAEFSIICGGLSGCLDLCGFAFSRLTGSNEHCHRIVESIRKNDAYYKAIAELAQLDSEISKCGTIFKNNIKKISKRFIKEDIKDLPILRLLRYYRETYLPAIYDLMMSCIYELAKSLSKDDQYEASIKKYFPKSGAFENTIKVKQRTAKSMLDKINAYFEVKAIL